MKPHHDYLVDAYDISGCSGEITVVSAAPPISVRAWQPDPAAAHHPVKPDRHRQIRNEQTRIRD
jgi:hypothetical protein